MKSITQNRLVRQAKNTRNQLLTASPLSTLPLAEVLSAEFIQTTLEDLGIEFRDRVFSPWVTIWTFLTQILNTDRSCRSAVSRVVAWLSVQRKKLCSSSTGGYVQARARLPEILFKRLCLAVASKLEHTTRDQQEWSFHGKPIKMADGTVLTLADTPENQKEFPQPKTRKKKQAPGFPLLRMLALISFSTGALLDLKIGPYAGKGSGEASLLNSLFRETTGLQSGDVLLMDRLLSSYLILATCFSLGIDPVVRMHASMNPKNLETAQRLGPGDRLVKLYRPSRANTSSDWSLLEKLPETLVLREIRHRIHVRGFRPKQIVLLTSLVDPQLYSKVELAQLYWSRWNCELDLRSIKAVMQMDELRCKTPEMIRKEIWTYALGYNLVRTTMAQSAIEYGLKPRELSFAGTLQLLNAFRPYLTASSNPSEWEHHYRALLKAISQQKLILRPGRTEPRAIKRKQSPYSMLNLSRSEARKKYWKKGTAYVKRQSDIAKIA